MGLAQEKVPGKQKGTEMPAWTSKGKSQPQRTSIEHNNHTETFPHPFFANLFFSMAQAPERRVFVDGIPFLMNEQWMRMHSVSLDIRSPTKVFFNRRGQHRSPTNGPSAFCGTSPKKKLRWSLKPWMAQSFLVGGEGFQPNLQGLTLPGSHWI